MKNLQNARDEIKHYLSFFLVLNSKFEKKKKKKELSNARHSCQLSSLKVILFNMCIKQIFFHYLECVEFVETEISNYSTDFVDFLLWLTYPGMRV